MAHERAGQPAQEHDLINVDELLAAYYDRTPDPTNPDQMVVFGTSGHRGSSLDTAFQDLHIAATTQAIGAWLAERAGTYKKVQRERTAPPQDRITRSAWFVREHDEVGAAVWKRPAIKSATNCAACHTRAAEGRFSEHEIRIPK